MLGWKKDRQRQPPRWYKPDEMADVDLAAYDREMARYVSDAFSEASWQRVSGLRIKVELGLLGGPRDGATTSAA